LIVHRPNKGLFLSTFQSAKDSIRSRTGRKPTLRTYEMLCWYFTGMADEEELLAYIAKLQKQD
jgi:hypothetical protein